MQNICVQMQFCKTVCVGMQLCRKRACFAVMQKLLDGPPRLTVKPMPTCHTKPMCPTLTLQHLLQKFVQILLLSISREFDLKQIALVPLLCLAEITGVYPQIETTRQCNSTCVSHVFVKLHVVTELGWWVLLNVCVWVSGPVARATICSLL